MSIWLLLDQLHLEEHNIVTEVIELWVKDRQCQEPDKDKQYTQTLQVTGETDDRQDRV